MEQDQKVETHTQDLFTRFGDRISEACDRAVREALLKHKLAGNSVAVFKDGRLVLLQPEEIEVD
jgi:hypothetical protein